MARRRINLPEFLLRARDRIELGIEHDRARRGRALIDREQMVRHRPYSAAFMLRACAMKRDSAARSSADNCNPSLVRRHSMSSASQRPFALHQIAHLGGRQVRAETFAEILERLSPRRGYRRSACHKRCTSRLRMRRAQKRPCARASARSAPRRRPREYRRPAAARARSRRGRPAKKCESICHRGFRQLPVGRDLAAEHREQRRLAIALVEIEMIVARGVLRLRGAVVVKRAHAGKASRPRRRARPPAGNIRSRPRRDI